MRLEIPSPVCCQNCRAIGKASEGNKTICRDRQDDDEIVGEVEDVLSSGQTKNSIRRTRMGASERLAKNSRQNSATFFDGHRRHLSSCVPNFFSQMLASYCTPSAGEGTIRILIHTLSVSFYGCKILGILSPYSRLPSCHFPHSPPHRAKSVEKRILHAG